MKKITALFLALLPILIFTSCFDGGDGDDKEPFQAAITLSADAIKPGGESITVDASSSTGVTSSALYIWTISGGSSGTIKYGGNEVELSTNSSSNEFSTYSSTIEFISAGTGDFGVNLRIEQNGQFTGTSASFSVAGSISLSTVPDGYEFIDINYSSDVPDYIFEGDVTLSNVNFDISSGSEIVFETAEGSQVVFDNSISYSNSSTLYLTFGSPEGTTWKGVYIKSSASFSTYYNYITLKNAGNEGIESYAPAAIVIEKVPSSVYLTTSNCQGYDIAFGNTVSSLAGSGFYIEGDGDGIIAPISIWPNISQFYLPITLESDINTQVNFNDSEHIYLYGDVYIKGGATISSYFSLTGYTVSGESRYPNIYIEEDGALIFGGGGSFTNVNFLAEEEDQWRGIYAGSSCYFNNISITNAGSAPISSTSISTTEKAAIYVADDLYRFYNSKISGSGGYGIYTTALLAPTSSKDYYRDNVFENTTQAAVRLSQEYGALFSGVDNNFIMNEGIAAVEVFQSSNNPYGSFYWETLGGDNFYHFTGNLNVSSTYMNIEEGAHFKFDVGKGFYLSGTGGLYISGTSESPVTMSAAGTSWAGIFIGGIGSSCSFVADYLTVDSGGGITMTGATEAANLVVDTDLNSPSTSQFNIKNSTFSNSLGYGAVIESGNGFSFDLTGLSLSNTFSGNTSGTFIDKTLP